jgi:hypothetical protein
MSNILNINTQFGVKWICNISTRANKVESARVFRIEKAGAMYTNACNFSVEVLQGAHLYKYYFLL